MAFLDFLTMDIEVWRRSLGALNDYGEQSDTWSKQTTIKGVIQPSNGNTSRTDPGIMKASSHLLFCLIGSNILDGDKVKYGNKFYNVLFVKDAAGRAHHFEVSLGVDE